MAIDEIDIRPGAVYVLDCYVYVQVLSVGSGSVIYRIRRRNAIGRAVRVKKTISSKQFADHALAEVNGEYFPDFADLRVYQYRRAETEEISLRDHLAQRAPHRPFVAG